MRQRTKISQKVFSSSIARIGFACTGGCSFAASTTGVSSSKKKASAENAMASTFRISRAEEPQNLQDRQACCMHASKTQSMVVTFASISWGWILWRCRGRRITSTFGCLNISHVGLQTFSLQVPFSGSPHVCVHGHKESRHFLFTCSLIWNHLDPSFLFVPAGHCPSFRRRTATD